MQYDVVIIGAGPAGLTAAIYTSRRNLKTVIISKNLGGQVITTPSIENYPGFDRIGGVELIQKFEKQVKNFGVEITYDEVESIVKKDDKFLVKTPNNEYEVRSVILAFGRTPRSLEVPGEKNFTGKGISYCAVCDMPLFKDKIVAVVGGGNSALDAALLGSDIAKKVYLIHRRQEFRGFESMVDKVKERENVEFILDSVVKEFKGNKFLKSIIVENVKSGEKKKIILDGVFVEIGSEVKTDFIKDLVDLDENGQVIVNQKCETSQRGIFAAGDITNTPFKQIIVASGEGAKAGLQAYNYIHGVEAPVTADWAHK